jgi:sugar (pentulose or hexulose) kinase
MTARTQAILGLDLGTTEIKAGLVTLDGRLVALTRSGYDLDSSGGHGWVEQDPGAWWSSVVSAVRALRAADLADIVAIGVDGHGPTLVAIDARGEATRPAITFLDSRASAEAAELDGATGIKGWSLGGLPAALGWNVMNRRRCCHALVSVDLEWLTFRLAGVADGPLVPDQVTADSAAVASVGVPADRLPPRSAMGSVVGGLTETAADALGLRPGIRSSAAPSTPSRAILAPGCSSPGMPTTRVVQRAASGVYWHEPVVVPGGFVTPAPLAGRYSVGAAMAATGRALDWYRDDVLGGHDLHGIPPGRGGRHAIWARRSRLPAVPRG